MPFIYKDKITHSKYFIHNFFSKRFATLYAILAIYITLNFLVRLVLLFISIKNISLTFAAVLKIFLLGFVFDLCTGLLLTGIYTLYLLLFPKKWIGNITDKIFTYSFLSIIFFIIFFSLMAEFPFWEEFGVRFNFIAVDYLIYTYEVFANINQTYPLPVIIAVLVVLVFLTIFLLAKRKIFVQSFSSKTIFWKRLLAAFPILALTVFLTIILQNRMSDTGNNLNVNELSKNGVFSFFAAFRSNELDYDTFYPRLSQKQAYGILKQALLQNNQVYHSNQFDDILRKTNGAEEKTPNIILLTIESLSAEFFKAFGNEKNITPNCDSIANESTFFTNLYATGTRTVRGMEALTLSVPPTPGNSIVRRQNNDNLFSIATVMKQKNYHLFFIYGGDGYFDNMNAFFGGQGFDIVDRNRGSLLPDKITTARYSIPKEEVSFENAWGICDEDLYKQSLKYADKSYKEGKPFFQFVMTTSNHKPFTFPENKIDLAQGNRDAAVKYTDYAIGQFIKEAKKKAWFSNTVFVIVADHCANSAGKWEINIDKHHIPAIIYNIGQKPVKENRLMSQIDLMPTVLGYLGWNYNSAFYGKDINQVKPGEERAFIGNYRTLGLLKGNVFTQINDRKKAAQFFYDKSKKLMTEQQTTDEKYVNETISYYQTASERFKKGKMKAD